MKTNRKAFALALAFIFVAAFAVHTGAQGFRGNRGPVRIIVSGMGNGTDPDQSTSDSNAYSQATMQAAQICPGMIQDDNYEKTSDSCVPLGSGDSQIYMCIVTVKAVCVAGGR